MSFLMIFGLLFAQLITVAYACPVVGSGASTSPALRPAMAVDCPDMGVRTGNVGTVCVTHCVTDQQADAQQPVSLPATCDTSPLVVRTQVHHPVGALVAYSHRASSRAPPPLDLSTRLLV